MGLLSFSASDARSQKPLQFGASAELVLIDLIATDGDGRLVTDLRADEIQVFEDGKRQPLEMLRHMGRPRATGAPASTTSPLATTPVLAPTPEISPESTPPPTNATPLRLVVVVDMGTMPSELLVPVRTAIVSMVRETLPGAELMLVALERGLHVRMPFTTDAGRFIAAVEALRPSAPGIDLAISDLVDQVERMCDGTTNADKNAIGLGRAFVEDVRQGLANSTEGMAALSRYLAPIPGRKHLVFYSGGYPMQPQSLAASIIESICYDGAAQGSGRETPRPGIDPRSNPRAAALQGGPNAAHGSLRAGAPVDSTGMLRALLDEANRSQVSVYTVDARGLTTDAIPASQRVSIRQTRLGNAQNIQQRAVREPQEILFSIAEGTGGTASLNTNDMSRGMQAAARDAQAYYLLSYAPPGGRKEGRFYPIEVKVTRPGLKVRYRRGYEWLSDQTRSDRALAAALRFPELYAQEGLAIDPWIEAGKLNVAVMLPTRILEFRNEGGQYLNDISVQAVLRDGDGRMVDNRYLFSKSIGMKLPENRYADLRARDSVEVANAAPVPKKGRYQLTVVARHSSGRLASASAEVEVP
jgi:VWFA-related protein